MFKKVLALVAALHIPCMGLAASVPTRINDPIFQGDVSAPQSSSDVVGNVDSLNVLRVYQLRLTGAGVVNLRGLAGGFSGKELLIVNGTGAKATITNNSSAVATASRIQTGTGDNLDFPANAAYRFVYSNGQWLIAGGGGGGGTSFTAQGPINYDATTKILSMPASTNSVDGYLTAADHAKLGGPSSLDPAQQTRLDNAESKNTAQDSKLADHETRITNNATNLTNTQTVFQNITDSHGARLDANDTKNNSQDTAIAGKQAAGNYVTSGTGEATFSGPGAAAVTLSNSAVTGKVLTGYSAAAGAVSGSDSILQAIQKIDANANGKQAAGNYLTALNGEATATGPGAGATTLSNSAVIGKTLTGYTAGAGTLSASDSILSAIQKVDGNKQAGPLTGDVTTPSAANPATTIAAGAVSAAKLADGAVDLTGTKATGTLPIAKGGTGAITKNAALVNLAPTCTDQQYLKYDGTAGNFVCAAVSSGAGDTYNTNNYTNTQFGQEWVGAVKITGCSISWNQSNTGAFANYTTLPTGCSYQVINGSTGISAPDTMVPGLKLTGKAGKYKIEATGMIGNDTASGDSFFRFTDGAQNSPEETDIEAAASTYTGNLLGTLDYLSGGPSAKTIQIQARTGTTNQARVYGTSAYPTVINIYRMNTAGQNSAIATVINGDGLAGTDWQSYMPTIGATTTAPTLGTNTVNAYWRRVGDSMEIKYSLAQTSAGTLGSGTYLIPLPLGYYADASKVSFSTNGNGAGGDSLGTGRVANTTATATTASVPVTVYGYNNANLYLVDQTANTQQGAPIGSLEYGATNSPYYITFRATVPIQGWSSNVTMAKSKAYYISEKNLTRVTATPVNVGEYRSLGRSAASDVQGVDIAPPAIPTSTDGFRLYTAATRSAADPGPSRYEINIGKNKSYKTLWFSSPGKTGNANVAAYTYGASVNDIGAVEGYDPTTGIAIVRKYNDQGSANLLFGTATPVGGGATVNLSSLYFDILVTDKAQVVGVERGDLAAAQVTPFVTEWKSFSLSATVNGGTAPNKGTVFYDQAFWRRNGADTIEVKYDYEQTAAGAAGSGIYDWPLPPGFTIDTTKQQFSRAPYKYFLPGSSAYASISGVADGTGPSSQYGQVTPVSASAVNIVFNNNVASTSDQRSLVQQSNTFAHLGNASVKFSFYYKVPVTQYSGAQAATIITKDPQTSVASVLATGTRVTTTPTQLGQYRSYTRAASSVNYTDAAPNTLPTAADGMRLWGSGAWGTADAAGNVSRYEIYVGQNRGYAFRPSLITGRSGYVNTSFQGVGASGNCYGVGTNYDSNSGILEVATIAQNACTSTMIPGLYNQGNTGAGNIYFDISLFDNPLAAGLTQAQDEALFVGGAGYGSTNTGVRRWTALTQKGSAISCNQSATLGDSCTINTSGLYNIDNWDYTNSANQHVFAVSKNASPAALTDTTVGTARPFFITNEAESNYNTNVDRANSHGMAYLSAGDVIRSQPINGAIGGAFGGVTQPGLIGMRITKLPSPFEVAGSAGGNTISSAGQRRLEAAKIGTGCTVIDQDGGSWITSATQTTSGVCTFGITGFSDVPKCGFSGDETVTPSVFNTRTTSTANSLVVGIVASTNSAAQNPPFRMTCQGRP